jgi:hypothetical protein
VNKMEKSVIVPSSIRFAVVTSDRDYPVTILSSDEEVGNLKGYFSLRESGLKSIMQEPSSGIRSTIGPFSILFGLQHPTTSIHAIDFWTDGEVGNRGKLYSVIFDLMEWDYLSLNQKEHLSEAILLRAEEISRLEISRDVRRLEYLGQAIAAIFIYARDIALSRRNIIKQKNEFITKLGYVYMIAMLSAAVYFAFTQMR